MRIKKILCVLLCMCFVIGGVSCNNGGGNTSNTSENTVETTENIVSDTHITIAAGGRSDYVVVYDGSDANAKILANELVTKIYSASGVFLKTQDVKTLSKVNEYEIIVGSARECVSALTVSAAAEDFAVAVVDNDLILWASDAKMYERLTDYVGYELFSVNNNNTVSFEKTMFVMFSKGGVNMSFINMFSEKSSDYVVVYDADVEGMKDAVNAFTKAIYSKCGVTVRSKDAKKYSSEHEIVVGDVREGAAELAAEHELAQSDDFMICIKGDDLYIYATETQSYLYAFEYITNEMLLKISDGYLMLSSADDITHSTSANKDVSYVKYYQSLYGTYSSQIDDWIVTKFNTEDKEDAALVEALVKRLGKGFAVCTGSSSALYDGKIVKLDKSDYSKSAKMDGGNVKVPLEFAQEYFGSGVTADSTGYVNVTDYCKNKGYSLYTDSSAGISVIMPADGTAFGQIGRVEGYTDAEYIARMEKFFVNPYSPEPTNNTEQSRVVIDIDEKNYDVDNITDYTKATYSTFYDPAIITVKERDGSTTIYAAYAETLHVNGTTASNNPLHFKKSRDGGKSWEHIATLAAYSAPAMFEYNGIIYIIGGFADVQVIKYDPATGTLNNTKFSLGQGAGGVGTVLVHDGRVYKSYKEAVISASLDSNLLISGNWTVSSKVSDLYYNAAWRAETGFKEELEANPGYDWEEGSVLLGKDGKLYVMYRSNRQIGTMLLYEISKDGKTLSHVTECNGTRLAKKSLVKTPSSIARCATHYDETTGLYISFMSLYMGDSTTEYMFVDYMQRAVLAMVVSKDLVNWTVVDTVLVDRMMLGTMESMAAHGFQYAEFAIDGDDIVLIVRENSGERTVKYCHDAPAITFYRLSDYKTLLENKNIIG